eukprot:TRINITY_DN5540_c0_g1_i2.p3 TRINITY_DN5540_c0_g1~~TRINITY_DN5540_c0_g1_i2.p3  ORF type:complete len:178 (-),score=33.76 TRINITY_DN5540_c0_g1_i2:181-714(-)
MCIRDSRSGTPRTPKKPIKEFDPRDYLVPGLSVKDIEQIKEVFDTWDYNGNGLIAPAELRNVLTRGGYKALSSTVYDIISELDENESGGLDFGEFARLLQRKPKEDTRGDIDKVFKRYDRRRRGYFDIEDLTEVANELKEEVAPDVLMEMIKKADSDGDGRVTFDDFYRAMISKVFV